MTIGNRESGAVGRTGLGGGGVRPERAELAIVTALALATFAVYGQSFRFEFVNADDHLYILQNAHVLGGLSGSNAVWAFTTPALGNWHPVTWLSHMIGVEWLGIENPGAHHATGVTLHLLNTLLLYFLLRAGTGARWRSGFVAALFCLHPLHVEPVAWVSERKELLGTFFGLVSIGFYGAWAKSKPTAQNAMLRVVSVVAMVLSVLSKPMWVTLPFVLLLLDIWPLERATLASAWKLVREKIAYFAVSAVSCGVTLVVQSQGGAMNSGEAVGFGLRALNAIVSYVRYLGKVAWPTELSILYPHPYIPGTGALPWPAWKAVAAGLLLMMITAWVIRARKRRYLVVGWLGFLGTLVPVIGLVQVGVQAMADRYTYLPLIFIFVALSWGLADFVERMAPRFPAIRETVVALALTWLVALAGLAWQQASHWEDSLSLFGHAVAVSPDNAVMQLAYATALAEEGQFAQSAVHGRRAIRIRPEYGAAHSVLGTALSRMGRQRAALNHHAKAVLLLSDTPEAFLSYGHTLARSGDAPAAMAAYRRALELRPDDRRARDSLEKLEADARAEPVDRKSN